MNSKQWKSWTNVVVSTLLANALVFSQSALAGQNQSSRTTTESTQKTASQQPSNIQPAGEQAPKPRVGGREEEVLENSRTERNTSSSGAQEGIRVHGHWTIEVRNPDGSVVTHREFENALAPSPALASILARQVSAGFWTIALFPGTVCGNTNNAGCSIGEPGQTGFAWNSSNLSVTVSGNSLVLSGTVLAAGGGTITTVQTGAYPCLATVAPSSPCQNSTINLGFGAGGGFIFTQTSPNAGVAVSAGQTIAVTVNISFS